MSKIKIKPNHVLAYAVRGRRKFGSIITPQKQSYSDFFDFIPVWVAQIGDECHIKDEGVDVGTKCLLRDAFELESLHLKELDYPVPPACQKEADDYDGVIELNILHENSLLGVIE